MGQWGVTGPLARPLCLQPGLFTLLSSAFTAAHVLSGMATPRLSGCDMGMSFPPRAVPGFSIFGAGAVAVPVGV